MSIILRVGQTLQLPSRNAVVVVKLGPEVVCVFAPGSKRMGEIVFTAAWLRRFAIVLDQGR